MFRALNDKEISKIRASEEAEVQEIREIYLNALKSKNYIVLDNFTCTHTTNDAFLLKAKKYLRMLYIKNAPELELDNLAICEDVRNDADLFLIIADRMIDLKRYVKARRMLFFAAARDYYTNKYYIVLRKLRKSRKIIIACNN